MITLTQLIDEYLASERPKNQMIPMTIHFDDEKSPKFRVSDAGRCRLYRYWKRQGKKKIQPDANGLRIMEMGNIIHAWLAQALQNIGVLIKAEIEVEDEYRKGHADALVKLGEHTILYDFKTISSKQAGYMLHNGCHAKRTHAYQVFSYFEMIRDGYLDRSRNGYIHDCRILYVTRETFNFVAETPVEMGYMAEVRQDWQILCDAWDAQREPEANPDSWECRYCPYRETCPDCSLF